MGIQRETGAWDPQGRVAATSVGAALLDRAAPDRVAGLQEYLLDHVDPEEFRIMGRAFHRLCQTLVHQQPT